MQVQQQQQRAAAPAVRPLAPRSVLAARSTRLSSGAIAGAVVGSVVGALLVALCLFPFVVRARRRSRARHGDPGMAEMGQRPGSPVFAAAHERGQDLDDGSSPRLSKDHMVPGPGSSIETGTAHDRHPANGPVTTTAVPGQQQAPHHHHHQHQHQYQHLPQGVALHQGLPSPASPTSGADSPPRGDGQAVSPVAAAAATATATPAQSPTDAAPRSAAYGSRGAVGGDSARQPSQSDSYGPSSRELAGIASAGITEEPGSFVHPSASPERGHVARLKTSLRSLIARRRSSRQSRDSRRPPQIAAEGERSRSITTNDGLPQPYSAPSGLEIDPGTRGLAWDYYNDPTLGAELSDSYAQPGPTSLGIAPTADAPTSAPLAPPVFQPVQISSPYATAGPVTEEPAFVGPDSDRATAVTTTPAAFGSSAQGAFALGSKPLGSLQRTDSLPPPTIVADIPSPPLQHTTGPSGNPMEIMGPTNSTESAWKLEHEMRIMQNSPSPPAPPTERFSPPTPAPADEGPAAAPAPALNPNPNYQPPSQSPYTSDQPSQHLYPHQPSPHQPSHQPTFQPSYQPSHSPSHPPSPYQPSPQPLPEFEVQIHEDPGGCDSGNMLTSPDYSSPPPSTRPSAENTPDTGLTPFTASPSPPSDGGAAASVRLGPSPSLSPGPSPGRSPSRPPGGFTCPYCGTVKSTLYEFK